MSATCALYLLLLLCSNCTWREGRVGNALDSRRVGVVDYAKGLFLIMVRVPLLCYLHVPLLCCLYVTIAIVIAIAVIGSRFSSFARTSMMMMKECCLLIRDRILQLPVRVLLYCCLYVTIATPTIVESCSSCSCCCGVPVVLGAKDVLAMLLIADVSALLMMLKGC